MKIRPAITDHYQMASNLYERRLMMKTLFAYACALVLLGAMPCFGQNASNAPVLVELFTSEGCSSCPPADRLLADLAASNGEGQPAVIALGEHVDYWNHDGWIDRFSSSELTARQNDYVRRFKLESAFTPQMVIDGVHQLTGNDRAGVAKAVLAASKEPPTAKLDLRWTSASHLTITVQSDISSADVLLAITEDGLTTEVRQGENHGRTLNHVAVVRRLQKIGSVSNKTFTKDLDIRFDKSWKREQSHVVVFVQEKNTGKVYGAASVTATAE
jgi:hypothetical protein